MSYAPHLYDAAGVQRPAARTAKSPLQKALAERDQRIRALYEQGYSAGQIGHLPEFKLSREAVIKALRRAGGTPRPGRPTRSQSALPVPPQAPPTPLKTALQMLRDQALDRAIARYLKGDVRLRDAAKEAGVGVSTLRIALTDRGLPRHPRGWNMGEPDPVFLALTTQPQGTATPGQVTPPKTDRNAEIVRRYQTEDLSMGFLASEYGLSQSRVKQILLRAGALRKRGTYDRAKKGLTRQTATPTEPTPTEAFGAGAVMGLIHRMDTLEGRILTVLYRLGDKVDDAVVQMAEYQTDSLGVMRSAIVAIANDLGIVVNPDGTIDRPDGDSVLAIHRRSLTTAPEDAKLPDPADQAPSPPSENGARAPWLPKDGDTTGAVAAATNLRLNDQPVYQLREDSWLPVGFRYMTDTERLQAWASRGGTPPKNLIVRDESFVSTPAVFQRSPE